jgi:hypothetical protein
MFKSVSDLEDLCRFLAVPVTLVWLCGNTCRTQLQPQKPFFSNHRHIQVQHRKEGFEDLFEVAMAKASHQGQDSSSGSSNGRSPTYSPDFSEPDTWPPLKARGKDPKPALDLVRAETTLYIKRWSTWPVDRVARFVYAVLCSISLRHALPDQEHQDCELMNALMDTWRMRGSEHAFGHESTLVR